MNLPRTAILIVLFSLTPYLCAQSPPANVHEEFGTAFDFARRFFEAGNFAAALTFFENADTVSRDQPAVLFNTALVLMKLERHDQAQQRLDRFQQLYPQSQHAERVKMLQREIQFAIEVRKRARHDEDYRLLFNRGRLLNDKGTRHEALEAFKQAEQLNPADPPLLFNMGALYEAEGDVERAVSFYRRYIATTPPNRNEIEQKLFDLENEIVEKRTRIMCPFCGEKLPVGARWCHRCWHGPYELDGALNARACGTETTVTRTATDVAGKVRENETLACLYPGASVRELVQYDSRRQRALWKQREEEGWTRAGGGPVSRARNGIPEIRLQQATHLAEVELLPAGEVYRFDAHQTTDGIWLLDAEPFAVADQRFDKRYVYDAEGRVIAEHVTYESVQCRHTVAYAAAYTYGDYGIASAVVRGGYEGSKTEGTPAVQWEATISRQFDSVGRLANEQVQVAAHQKTWPVKPPGAIGAQIRKTYPGLKAKRPIDLRPAGDFCGQWGAERGMEPIDLRALYTLSPALAIRLNPGVFKVVVNYRYASD